MATISTEFMENELAELGDAITTISPFVHLKLWFCYFFLHILLLLKYRHRYKRLLLLLLLLVWQANTLSMPLHWSCQAKTDTFLQLEKELGTSNNRFKWSSKSTSFPDYTPYVSTVSKYSLFAIETFPKKLALL